MNEKIDVSEDISTEVMSVSIPKELIPAFKQLIARGLNTFCDCNPALKEFGDILEYGKSLQDYYSQRSDIKITKR